MNLIDTLNQEYVTKMEAAAPNADFEVLVQMQPVTQSIVQHAAEKGGNVLGLEDKVADGPTIMWLVALTVDTAENQLLLEPLVREFRDEINRQAEELGVNKHWNFLNYSNGDEDPIALYGAENIAFLQGVSAKYDPEAVFQDIRKTGFKIPTN
jgi:hypothetical protein